MAQPICYRKKSFSVTICGIILSGFAAFLVSSVSCKKNNSGGINAPITPSTGGGQLVTDIGKYMGVNYNEIMNEVNYNELSQTKTKSVRGFLDVFLHYDNKDMDTNPRIVEYLKLKDQGYKTALNLKFNFKTRPYPAINSTDWNRYISFIDQILSRVISKTDVIIVGNEPFIESGNNTWDEPLNSFYKAVAARVNQYFISQNISKPIFIGSFDNMYQSDHQGIDDCWNDTAWVGKQPAPKIGVHNSGRVKDPGTMIYTHPDTLKVLKAYVKDILSTFKDDKRILMWDLYNEPGNNKQIEKSLPLLEKVFSRAREVNPSQPITSAVWNNGSNFQVLNNFQLSHSDVITYHNYAYIDVHEKAIDTLRKYRRPLICSEYMARKNGSLFFTIMPLLKKENVGAINWGFVSGKTNTIYAWDTPMPDGKEPQLWFHDILRKDGSPFSKEEIRLIKSLTGKK